jgi:predicted dehydrogenase
MRIGIIGAGNIGKAYAMAVAPSPLISLTAVCDTNEDQRGALGSTTGAAEFDSHESLAESELCEAVIVATPPSTHAAVTVACLERGLDVLCEKPFTLNVETAHRMFEAAASEHQLLAMASKFRYVSDIAQARDLIRSGVIGSPTMIDITFASHVDMSNRWNSVAAISGGGVLVDNGTHAVDIIRYLVGPIRRVSAMRGRSEPSGGVENTAIILAETDCHTIASTEISWSISPHNESYAVIHGTEGTITVGWSGSFHRPAEGGDWVSFGTGYSKMGALRSNVENFAGARWGYEALRITTADVLASVSVVEGAYRAIESRKWVDIHEECWATLTDLDGVAGRAG